MNKKTYLVSLGVVLLVISLGFVWVTAWDMPEKNNFDCWGRLHTRIQLDDCQQTSAADVFLSMYSKGEGYLLVNGSWSCQHSDQNSVEGRVSFQFEKEGDYYSIKASERVPALEKIIGVLRYPSLKVKITRLNSDDYILTLPNESLMICTAD